MYLSAWDIPILKKDTWNMCVLVAQSCPTLCNPMDYSSPGSSVHGLLQARILEWGAIPFSMGSSLPRNRTQVSCIAARFFMVWATGDGKDDRSMTSDPRGSGGTLYLGMFSGSHGPCQGPMVRNTQCSYYLLWHLVPAVCRIIGSAQGGPACSAQALYAISITRLALIRLLIFLALNCL